MSSVKSTPQTRLQAKRQANKSSSQGDDIPQTFILINLTLTISIISGLTYGYFKYHKSIVQVPNLSSLIDRLIYTLQLQTYCLIPFYLGIMHVIFHRVTSKARNPLSGHESAVEKPSRILSNTLEQIIFNFFNQIILVTFLPAEYLFVIPFLVFCFTFGRICFTIGYSIHPKYRTFGFALTFFPSTAIFIVNLLYVSGLNKYVFGKQSTKNVEF